MQLQDSDKIIQKIKEKRVNETPIDRGNRLVKTLEKREAALSKIKTYQDKTGIPTEEEAEKSFVETEAGMNYEDYKDLKKKDSEE
jgi:hypothetical protein